MIVSVADDAGVEAARGARHVDRHRERRHAGRRAGDQPDRRDGAVVRGRRGGRTGGAGTGGACARRSFRRARAAPRRSPRLHQSCSSLRRTDGGLVALLHLADLGVVHRGADLVAVGRDHDDLADDDEGELLDVVEPVGLLDVEEDEGCEPPPPATADLLSHVEVHRGDRAGDGRGEGGVGQVGVGRCQLGLRRGHRRPRRRGSGLSRPRWTRRSRAWPRPMSGSPGPSRPWPAVPTGPRWPGPGRPSPLGRPPRRRR